MVARPGTLEALPMMDVAALDLTAATDLIDLTPN